MKLNMRLLIPFGIFALLLVFLGAGLFLNPSLVPSPLVGKQAPQFTLTQLHDPQATISSEDLRGQVWLLNVWASWCVSCRYEHPLLVELARENIVPIYGLNYKDRREDGITWLRNFGNPYVHSLHDFDGRVGMDYGVYGVPETYVIDAEGVIRHKQIGPITADALKDKILPLVRELQG
jgi:cytochrome c biogenesis protein CcmG/thiol:disulfide interchange protein DsbE